MTTWEFIKELVSGAAAFFRAREKQGDRLNTPAMQANAKAIADARIREAATRAVEKNDLAEIRKLGGE